MVRGSCAAARSFHPASARPNDFKMLRSRHAAASGPGTFPPAGQQAHAPVHHPWERGAARPVRRTPPAPIGAPPSPRTRANPVESCASFLHLLPRERGLGHARLPLLATQGPAAPPLDQHRPAPWVPRGRGRRRTVHQNLLAGDRVEQPAARSRSGRLFIDGANDLALSPRSETSGRAATALLAAATHNGVNLTATDAGANPALRRRPGAHRGTVTASEQTVSSAATHPPPRATDPAESPRLGCRLYRFLQLGDSIPTPSPSSRRRCQPY